MASARGGATGGFHTQPGLPACVESWGGLFFLPPSLLFHPLPVLPCLRGALGNSSAPRPPAAPPRRPPRRPPAAPSAAPAASRRPPKYVCLAFVSADFLLIANRGSTFLLDKRVEWVWGTSFLGGCGPFSSTGRWSCVPL